MVRLVTILLAVLVLGGAALGAGLEEPGGVGWEDLTPVLRGAVERGDVGPVEGEVARAEELLLAGAWGWDLQLDFFYGCERGPAAAGLRGVLDEAGAALGWAEEATGTLLGYVDWYEGADWHERFEASGFYERLGRLAGRCEFARCVEGYYRARLGDDGELERALERIDGWLGGGRGEKNRGQDALGTGEKNRGQDALGTGEKDRGQDALGTGEGEGLRLGLWRDRLVRAGGGSGDYGRVSLPGEAGLAYAVWLEHLRGGVAGRVTLERLDQVERDSRLLGDWVGRQVAAGALGREHLVEVAVFRSGLLQRRRQVELSAGAGDQAIYLEQTDWLGPLAELASEHGQGEVAGQLAGARLAAAFAELPEGQIERARAEFLKRADGFGLASLARHCEMSEPGFAAELYDAAVEDSQVGREELAGLLARAGRRHRGIWAADPNQVGHGVRAVECWTRLAREWPGWTDGAATAGDFAEQATGVAVRLWQGDAGEYAALAAGALGVLVGELDGQGAPVGPFAERAGVGRYRYWLGRVLEGQRDYAGAAAWYELAGEEGEAGYRALWCRFAGLQGRGGDEEYEGLLEGLRELMEAGGGVGEAAELLAARVLHELGRDGEAVALLAGRQEIGPGAAAVAAAMVAGELAELEGLYARGRLEELAGRLGAVLRVARALPVGEEAGGRMVADAAGLAAMVWAELGEDGAVEWGPEAAGLAGEAIERLDGSSGAALRGRARLAFLAGDYERSRRLWYELRSGLAASAEGYWEARYFGLVCLARQGRAAELGHALEVLVRSGQGRESAWWGRIERLGKEGWRLEAGGRKGFRR